MQQTKICWLKKIEKENGSTVKFSKVYNAPLSATLFLVDGCTVKRKSLFYNYRHHYSNFSIFMFFTTSLQIVLLQVAVLHKIIEKKGETVIWFFLFYLRSISSNQGFSYIGFLVTVKWKQIVCPFINYNIFPCCNEMTLSQEKKNPMPLQSILVSTSIMGLEHCWADIGGVKGPSSIHTHL